MINTLVLFLILLQLADGVLTYLIIKSGGRELNPLLVSLDRWLRHRFDTHARWAWLAVAKAVAILLIAAIWAVGFWDSDAGAALLVVLTVFYLIVVHNNWTEYREGA